MADVEGAMGGAGFLLVLSAAMFFGSYFAGQIPLLFTMSESRLRFVSIFGAGLLVGTALAVIVPEGVEALYSAQKVHLMHAGHDTRLSQETKVLLESNAKGPPDTVRIIPKDVNLNQGLAAPIPADARVVKRDVPVKPTEKEFDFFGLRRLMSDASSHLGKEEDDHEAHADAHDEHAHGHSHEAGNIHSAIGYSLVCGFIFMLLVDQIGSSTINRGERSGRLRMSMSATIGLVVHAAADGIALGSASVINKSDVQLIVFLAIILHKAPSSFGLVSFLLMEGLDRVRIRKHLLIFSSSAPIAAMTTYFVLANYSGDPTAASGNESTTGILMLFSAGTFLYVATVHVLPELTQHASGPRNDYTLVDAQAPSTAGHSHAAGPAFTMRELGAIISGAIVPAILASGHSH